MDRRQIWNTSQEALIRYSFYRVYGLSSTSVINKVEPSVVKYILTTSSILDLSLNISRFKKHVTKRAFKTSFCRGLVGNYNVQTIQIVLHYSSESCNTKARMIAGTRSPFVPSVFELKTAQPAALPTSPNFQNKNLKQHKGLFFILPNRTKWTTKNEKERYWVPAANRAFFTSMNPHFVRLRRPLQSEGGDYAALQKAERWGPTVIRMPFSFKREILNKETIVKNSHRATYPPSCFLGSAFNPIFSFKNQGATTSQKWAKACAFKGAKNLTSHFLRADWLLNQLIYQLMAGQLEKKNPRTIINQLINNIRILIERTGSGCPVIGARVTLTGRLGSRKKGMAQQISKCVGTIPLSTLRQKVDYSQGVSPSRLGLVGVKVWVCYKS